MLKLGTITYQALAYTMALTLPGDFSEISPAFAKRCFKSLCNRATASRIPLISRLGFLWKQELQKRGAVHFHLVLYGLILGECDEVQRWFSVNWNELVCAGSSNEEREKHLVQHLRKQKGADMGNFQEIKNFAGYFAKYLGKAEEAQVAAEPIPGRWWGMVNRQNIPFADCTETELPERMRLHCQRLARKLRQRKANDAKHYFHMKEMNFLKQLGDEKGQPMFSRFKIECGMLSKKTKSGGILRQWAKEKGIKFGKAKLPDALKYGSVKFVGKNAVESTRQILAYGKKRYIEEKTHEKENESKRRREGLPGISRRGQDFSDRGAA